MAHQSKIKPGGQMAPFATQAGEQVLTQLETYWHQLRRDRALPLRLDVAADAVGPALPHAFIVQRVAPRVARIRVAGQKLHDILRMDARGMPLTVFLTADAHDAFVDHVVAAFDGPHIVSIDLSTPYRLGRPALQARMLLLPLNDQNGATSRLLGALVTDREPGLRATRFQMDDRTPPRCDPIHPHLRQIASNMALPTQRPDVSQRPALQLVVNNG